MFSLSPKLGRSAKRVGSALLIAATAAACSSTTVKTITQVQRGPAVRATTTAGDHSFTADSRTGTVADRGSTTSTQGGPTAPAQTAASTVQASTVPAATARPLAGKVVGVDPGHNGLNYTDPAYIDHQVWNGREYENCNTTGTETDSGYTEAQYNWNVATYLTADLHAEGAVVVLTRHSNDGIGPCVNRRAEIMNQAHANVAIAIHADGFLANGRGFTILEPVADGINNKVIGPSETFGRLLRARFLMVTRMPISNYDGVNGIQPRFNLAGTNLTTVPYVLIECGNMRNATDAALLVSTPFQRLAAKAIAQAITQFLTGHV